VGGGTTGLPSKRCEGKESGFLLDEVDKAGEHTYDQGSSLEVSPLLRPEGDKDTSGLLRSPPIKRFTFTNVISQRDLSGGLLRAEEEIVS
jgi:hypothetical protein